MTTTNFCKSCFHWGPITAKDGLGWGYCYKADWHNPKKGKFYSEPWDGGKDARLKCHETHGCDAYETFQKQPEIIEGPYENIP